MIFIYAFLGALIIGYLLGGRLGNYLNVPLRGLLFPILSFGIEAFAPLFERWIPWPVPTWLWAFVSVQYALSFCFLWMNRSRKSILVMAVGTVLNAVVIFSHGFRMPVTPMVYQHEGLLQFATRIESGELFEYVLVHWDAPLWWLGDTIPFLIGPPGLASIGDFLIAAGMGWLMVTLMRQKPQQDSAQTDAPAQVSKQNGRSVQ